MDFLGPRNSCRASYIVIKGPRHLPLAWLSMQSLSCISGVAVRVSPKDLKLEVRSGTYHGRNMLNMLQHAATELCNSMMPICQPSWTLTPVDVLIDRPTIFEASKHSCWFRGLLTG